MKFFSIFLFSLGFYLVLPVFLRGLEKFYEQSYLIYKLSSCFQHHEGYTYRSSFSQKSMVCTKLEEILTPFVLNPEKFIQSYPHQIIKKRGGQTLYKVRGSQDYVIKVFEQKGFFKNLFKENRVMSLIAGANKLEQMGIKTSLPVAFVLKRKMNSSVGYCLSKVISGKSALQKFKKSRGKTTLSDVENLFSVLKRSNLIHGDLTPMNILFDQQGTVIIDTSDVHSYPKFSPIYYLRHIKEASFCFRHFDYE